MEIFKKSGEQIILGSVLGDAYVYKDKRYEGYGFIDKHNLKEKNYLLWKNSHLIFNFKVYTKYNICMIRKGHPIFKYYRELFYKNGIKVLSFNILNKLKPLAIAVWFMDDGNFNYKTNTLRLSTHCFGLEGNKMIKQWFNDGFSIDPKIRRVYDKRWKKEYYYLEFTCVNAKMFISLIKDFVIGSMGYKIGDDLERKEISREKKRLYDFKWRGKNKDKIRNYYLKNKLTKFKSF
jgi:recombination protein RecA